jgi:short-subunit dehydrogenase
MMGTVANGEFSVIHPMWVRTPMIKMLTDHESHFRQPIMTPQVVSAAICKQILTQSSGQIILPASQSVASMVRAMPSWMQEGVRAFASGALKRMRLAQAAEEAAAR